MLAKQVSLFIENRKGRLGEILEVLKKNNVNIISLSLADTTDYGILRLIVSDPEICKDMLQKNGFSTMITEVLIAQVDHKSGSLQNIVNILSKNEINIEYMYGLSIDGKKAYVVIKTSNPIKACELLQKNDIYFLGDEELKKL